MTNTALVGDDDLICDARLEGVGRRTAEHLESVGITSVRDLADARPADLAAALEPSFPNLRPGTLGARAEQWIEQARDRLRSTANARSARAHVFLLTLWTDVEGRPVRSRVEHRHSDEPTSEVTSTELAGWSPAAFARFVERTARLTNSRALTDERIAPLTDVVEWSRHLVEGQLIRGGPQPVEIRAQVTTAQHGDAGPTRYRAVGRVSPLGGGTPIMLGSCSGRVEPGAPMMFEFGAHHLPDRVHRAWFEVALSPPTAEDTRVAIVGSTGGV